MIVGLLHKYLPCKYTPRCQYNSTRARRDFRQNRPIFRHPELIISSTYGAGSVINTQHDSVAPIQLLTRYVYRQCRVILIPGRTLPIEIHLAQEVIAQHPRYEHEPLHIYALASKEIVERLSLTVNAAGKLLVGHPALVELGLDDVSDVWLCWQYRWR